MVPCFPLLGLTPSGLFMGLSSTVIYTSELILCSTICNFNSLFDWFFVCMDCGIICYSLVAVLLFSRIVFVLQGMFEPYLKGFFVHSSDPTHIRLLKVNILVTTCKYKLLLIINYRPFSKNSFFFYYSPKPWNQVEI